MECNQEAQFDWLALCYDKIYIYVWYYQSISLLQKDLSNCSALLNDFTEETNDIYCVCSCLYNLLLNSAKLTSVCVRLGVQRCFINFVNY